MDWVSKAGSVDVRTAKYTWSQTIEEVIVSIPVPPGTKAKEIVCEVKQRSLKVGLKGHPALVDGELFDVVKAKDAVWTLEDGKIELILSKSVSHMTWTSLLKGDVQVDPFTKEEMQKKMMLEKFQNEHPGFDFSGAEFSGQVPQDPKNFARFD